jgi:hypothetical protein
MPRRIRPRLALPVVIAVALLAVARGQDRDRRNAFMREKLGYSKDLLEGLTREDYARIGVAARALQSMREVGTWAAPNRPEAARYKAYALEFQELTKELATKAEERNLDGATLAYARLTTNCVNCHKEIRTWRR